MYIGSSTWQSGEGILYVFAFVFVASVLYFTSPITYFYARVPAFPRPMLVSHLLIPQDRALNIAMFCMSGGFTVHSHAVN